MIAELWERLRRPSVTNQPPAPGELRRNDLAVLLVVLLALLLGLAVRSWALGASRSFALGEDLPTLRYPLGWRTSQTETFAFQALNPHSPSHFDARVEVRVSSRPAAEPLDLARAAWSIQRSQDLLAYRELAAEPLTVQGEPALLIHYAYVADPTRASGVTGVPVVVEAQDLLFLRFGKLVVVTVAADATEFATAERDFALVFASLGLEPLATDDLLPLAPITPALDEGSAP